MPGSTLWGQPLDVELTQGEWTAVRAANHRVLGAPESVAPDVLFALLCDGADRPALI